jgi:hypothetical protein
LYQRIAGAVLARADVAVYERFPPRRRRTA